jgi:hypothetical protein
MRAVQPDNSLGPATRLTAGAIGCSLLTNGRQNPVTFMDGTWRVCGTGMDIDPFDQRKAESRLASARDQFRTNVEPIADLGIAFPDVRSDAEMTAVINETQLRFGVEPGSGRSLGR